MRVLVSVIGRGFEWNKPKIDVCVGQCVRWLWAATKPVYNFLVQQTVDDLATGYDGSGFKSTASGSDTRGTAHGKSNIVTEGTVFGLDTWATAHCKSNIVTKSTVSGLDTCMDNSSW